MYILCTVDLDLVTLNLVTSCDLVTILQRPFSIYYIKSFDLVTFMQFSDSLLQRPNVSLNRDSTVSGLWRYFIRDFLS